MFIIGCPLDDDLATRDRYIYAQVVNIAFVMVFMRRLNDDPAALEADLAGQSIGRHSHQLNVGWLAFEKALLEANWAGPRRERDRERLIRCTRVLFIDILGLRDRG